MAVEVENARGLPGGLKLVELPSGKTLRTVDPHTDSPVENPQLIHHLHDEVLAIYLSDNVKARRLLADGTYEPIKAKSEQMAFNSQAWLIGHRPTHTQADEL